MGRKKQNSQNINKKLLIDERKKRNSEKRKEKSRDAARCRRDKESKIFNELAASLPLPEQTVAQLDKASIMRLTIAFLRIRELFNGMDYESKLQNDMDSLMQKALDGFLLVLSPEGDVVYTSDNITTVLGLNQVDVIGQSLLDYAHPCDHDELRDFVTHKGPSTPRHAFLRLKCILSSRGRSTNLRSASFKVFQILGEVINNSQNPCVVALAIPIPHPSNIEMPLDKQTFISKHSLDMKFTYVDENILNFCGYEADDLLGKSLYEMHHALDCNIIKKSYKLLKTKGQIETGRYRFLARGGGYVWVVTQATVITVPRDHKPQHIICLHYVVSGVEAKEEVLSEVQVVPSKETTPPAEESSQVNNDVIAPPPGPVRATLKLMTSRTKDMNKGFLTFSDDDNYSTVLKEEPEDLTHLAPSVGDTCVPLEVPIIYSSYSDILSSESRNSSKISPLSNERFSLRNQANFTGPENLCSDNSSLSDLPLLISDDYNDQSEKSEYIGSEIQPVGLSPGFDSSIYDSPIATPIELKTPDPPAPLLTQAAFTCSEKPFEELIIPASNPVATTAKLFTPMDSYRSSPTMEMLDPFIKLEDLLDNDEFDLRAPYIPTEGDVMINNFEDQMWNGSGSSKSQKYDEYNGPPMSDNIQSTSLSNNHTSDTSKGPSSSTLECLLKNNQSHCTNDMSEECSEIMDNFSLMSRKLNSNFVDPNKVLPNNSGLDSEKIEKGSSYLRLIDKPPFLLDCNALISVDTQLSNRSKRASSPPISPKLLHKKLCPSNGLILENSSMPRNPASQPDFNFLPVPNAPIMQQLLNAQDSIKQLKGNSALEALLRSDSSNSSLKPTRIKIITSSSGMNSNSGTYRLIGRQLTRDNEDKPEIRKTNRTGLKEDSLLLMDPNLTVPSLLNLTQQDYEVNAPAGNSSLLQGADLLKALDQSSDM